MKFLNFIKSLTSQTAKSRTSDANLRVTPTLPSDDHLSHAAVAKEAAGVAARTGNFDDAWRLLHKAKDHYAQHAAISGLTDSQFRDLDGAIHEDLANVLHLEGRDDEALAQLIYSAASSREPVSRFDQKLQTYLRRSSFKNVQLEDVKAFIKSIGCNPSRSVIREKFADWNSFLPHQAKHAPNSEEFVSLEFDESSSSVDDSIAVVHQLIRVLAEAVPLSIPELERLWRKEAAATKIDFIAIEQMEPAAREKYIAELEAQIKRQQVENENTSAAKAWANASGDRSNDLVIHCLATKELFETYLKTGTQPPPHHPWRIAVILRRMKEHILEKEFLANWAKHFGTTRGAGYEKLKKRYENLC